MQLEAYLKLELCIVNIQRALYFDSEFLVHLALIFQFHLLTVLEFIYQCLTERKNSKKAK